VKIDPYVEHEHTGGRQIPERPYVRPAPTIMPGPLEGEPRAELPTARVHVARARRWPIAVAFAVLAIVGCWQYGQLLNRIDSANAEAQRAYAHTAVLRVELEHLELLAIAEAALKRRARFAPYPDNTPLDFDDVELALLAAVDAARKERT
jgi:hypothetical protein